MSHTQHTEHLEHLVLTTVVKDAEWRADPGATRTQARATLTLRAQQSGLRLQGEPREEIEILSDYQRVRIVLTANAVPLKDADPPSPQQHGQP